MDSCPSVEFHANRRADDVESFNVCMSAVHPDTRPAVDDRDIPHDQVGYPVGPRTKSRLDIEGKEGRMHRRNEPQEPAPTGAHTAVAWLCGSEPPDECATCRAAVDMHELPEPTPSLRGSISDVAEDRASCVAIDDCVSSLHVNIVES